MENIYRPDNGHSLRGAIRISSRFMAIVTIIALFFACNKEGGLEEPDILDPLETPQGNLQGSLEEVVNFYNTEFVQAMQELEININLGNNPPSLQGSYLISPLILEVSTVEQDSALLGGQFEDYLITFSNQNNHNLSIDLEGSQASQIDDGSGSFITGDGGAFTVYSKTTSQLGTTSAETAITISGILTADGITNIQFFGAMLDDNGDPQSILIENNTGRLLVDGDDFSSKETQTSKKNSSNLTNWSSNQNE